MTARSEALSTRREALRDDLFGPPQDPIGDDSTRVMDDEPRAPGSLQGDDDEDGGLLELEHVIGFTGAHLSTLIALPRLSNAFVKSMGSVVVVGDVVGSAVVGYAVGLLVVGLSVGTAVVGLALGAAALKN